MLKFQTIKPLNLADNLCAGALMKITSSNSRILSPVALPKTGSPTVSQAPATVTTPSSSSEASVAPHLQHTGTLAAADAPFDSQRVAEIRQAIADGRFQINVSKIADNLLAGVRDLLAQDKSGA